MKFGQLKIGTAFEFEGKTYIKTSPVIGRCQSNDSQKFFRRAMDVASGEENSREKPVSHLSQSQVSEAFKDFYRHCEQCLQELAAVVDASRLQRLSRQLEDAKQDFLSRIN